MSDTDKIREYLRTKPIGHLFTTQDFPRTKSLYSVVNRLVALHEIMDTEEIKPSTKPSTKPSKIYKIMHIRTPAEVELLRKRSEGGKKYKPRATKLPPPPTPYILWSNVYPDLFEIHPPHKSVRRVSFITAHDLT